MAFLGRDSIFFVKSTYIWGEMDWYFLLSKVQSSAVGMIAPCCHICATTLYIYVGFWVSKSKKTRAFGSQKKKKKKQDRVIPVTQLGSAYVAQVKTESGHRRANSPRPLLTTVIFHP